jgi:hypothetical protein
MGDGGGGGGGIERQRGREERAQMVMERKLRM